MDDNGFYPLPEQGAVMPHQPDTTVYLFGGVPWDNTYNNVRLFSSKDVCLQFLMGSYLSYTITGVSDVDYGSLTVAVPITELQAMQYNYMAIVKTQGGVSNIQFAFTISTQRSNRNSCTIQFEMDVWMNNINNVTFNTTFIERAHVEKALDVAGAYTEDEGLEYGEYISGDKLPYAMPDYTDPNWSSWSICIVTSFNESGAAVGGDMMQNVYTGATFNVFDNAAQANNFISAVTEKNLLDGILQIFMLPTKWCDGSQLNYANLEIDKIHGSIDGYQPKNQKLFTYPYVLLHVNNNCGSSVNLRQEFFSSSDMRFKAATPLSTNPKMYLFAENYKGINLNSIDTVNFEQFPTCAVSADSYKAWLAQTGAAQFAGAVSDFANSKGVAVSDTAESLIGGIAASLIGGAASGGSVLGTVTNVLKQNTQAYIQPPSVVGTQGGNGLYQVNRCEIDFYRMTIRAEFAKKIDDYFTMFGYKINQFGSIPYYMNTRSRYNFIKTKNCNIRSVSARGVVEPNDLAKLRSIFDNGVTIWHVDTFGDYAEGNNK